MSNTVFYSAVLGADGIQARTLKSRLGTIAGRSAADGLVALRADPTP